MTETFYTKRHAITFKITEQEEDIYQFINGFSSLQKAVDFIFTWRYTLDSLGIVLKYKESKIHPSPASTAFKQWLNKNASKKIIFIQDNNVVLYEYLVKIKEEKVLAKFLKESIRLYLYGKKGKTTSKSSNSVTSTDKIEHTLEDISSKVDQLLELQSEAPKYEEPSPHITQSKEVSNKENDQAKLAAKNIFGGLGK